MSYRFEPSGHFICIACGKEKFANDTRIRFYQANMCSHPALRELGPSRICTSCYNWDYDAHRRKRMYERSGLNLKGGIHIDVHPPSVKPEVAEFRKSFGYIK